MENFTSRGQNRTGAELSPGALRSMQDYADQHSPESAGGEESHLTSVRADYVREAERVGSVSVPTAKGKRAKASAKQPAQRPEVLVDKLGERLAYERSGARLYEALIDKVEALEANAQLPFTRGDLEHIHDEELEHMRLVAGALETIGADPTAQTPSADVSGVAASGVLQVVTDPRTTISQCLSAILTAELADHASWELLIALVEKAGHDALLPQFEQAHQREEEHVQKVRDWLTQLVMEDAGASA